MARIVGDYKIMHTLGQGIQGKWVQKLRRNFQIILCFFANIWVLFVCLTNLTCTFSLRVKKAQRKDGTVVALKLVNKSTLTASSVLKLRKEVEAMYTCKHPYVTKLHDVHWNFLYPKKNGTKVPCVLMELEFAEGGELFNFLMYTGCFPEDIARTYFQQLVTGLAQSSWFRKIPNANWL